MVECAEAIDRSRSARSAVWKHANVVGCPSPIGIHIRPVYLSANEPVAGRRRAGLPSKYHPFGCLHHAILQALPAE
ncbi:putative uncharacterized protein pph79 [Pseudomonas syringae pv. pisi]|uniref:Uncharacterized protein n=1 Tax=Pseudomonas syringae pv. pisi TaxID=59510 RepID=A0A3M3UFP3_PSESJ|nr:putative uncharacterized protein pph79 [Pseudomonas syringae pv. pisi]